VRTTIPADAPMTVDQLPSWNAGASKTAIVDFVSRVTTLGGQGYVLPEQRIATFDNDGTLWSEQPYYFQVDLALDQIRALAPQHLEWLDKDPFKSVLTGRRRRAFCDDRSPYR
jgi:hypothetical protein